ncbi:sushi, von Willebrand factor type A, EGF and pentraxin domain-containing protein 1-like isoform X2 [Montipora foliosa]|uniref:sushi, von Willebrand factor type A, EGF and pentraxin domain-containing protein 1-like isoform X2 n=1 Tax=Montipora foliosa TaxID=591990 RepID=UPI0035F1AF05
MVSLQTLILVLFAFAKAQGFFSRLTRRISLKKCTFKYCRGIEWKDDWNPSQISQGKCVKQTRKSHGLYSTQTIQIPGNCPSTVSCPSNTETRTMCSCKNAYHCPYHTWSSWTGIIAQGTCGRQSRYRDYNEHVKYDIRENNCNGIQSSCGSRQYNYRDWCSCKYAQCTLSGWSSWSDLPTPVDVSHCASQRRTRSYSLTWLYTERQNNCDGVSPQSCPSNIVETREKIVMCPPLASPSHGSWHNDDCAANSQSCPSVCLLQCDISNGFQLEGPNKRECLASGQWSTPWASYCKDVRPPTITCPQSISTPTDPGKPTKRVCIPDAVAVDNSGQQPTISNNAGAQCKDFEVSGIPHEVRYTARDAAGLTSTCALQIRVSDQERPRIASCPSDFKKETNQNEIRVTWDYPVFEDNFDRPPVQLTISSNRSPGASFPWGRYQVVYTATDRAGNKATCEFYLEVGPVPCTYFEAPAYGVRSCNKNTSDSNGILYEMACVIQCVQGYSFADPAAANTYLCRSDGTWLKLLYGGQFPQPVSPKSLRPWPDCAPEQNVNAAKKNFTFYTGSCSANEQEALLRIRQNFLDAVSQSPLAKLTLCDASQGQDCVVENVRVYCGSNSRKRSVGDQRIITLDFVMKDNNASSDPKTEAAKVKKMMSDLDVLAKFVTENFPADAHMPDLQVYTANSTAACPAGKVVMVAPGNSPVLERTACVECPAGSYYNRDSQTCQNCQEGTYQNSTGKMTCIPCPQGTWTVGTHARNYTECFEICEPGEYTVVAESGVMNCFMCPIATYQPKFRGTKCEPCPAGKTTLQKASTSIADCQ